MFNQNREPIKTDPTELCQFSQKYRRKVPPESIPSVLAFFFPLLMQIVEVSAGTSAPSTAHLPERTLLESACAVPPVGIVFVDSLVDVLLEVCEF